MLKLSRLYNIFRIFNLDYIDEGLISQKIYVYNLICFNLLHISSLELYSIHGILIALRL